LHGYGNLLDIDLSAGAIRKKAITPEFAREYIGGMGFSCKILYDEVGIDVDPLGPDNIVVFANGPLSGTTAPCACRTEITNKSPLTGSIGSGNTGGLWGALLKHAGFDVVIIRGKAEKPVYLWIDNDKVEIRQADHLWGKDTKETSDALIGELDPSRQSRISVLTIGPAGENLVRYACPLNDYHHCAARGGSGAVMGSKKLKAIAVRGTGAVEIANPVEFQEAVRETRERLMLADKAATRHDAPSPSARKRFVEKGGLSVYNYQRGIIPNFIETRGIDIARKYITRKDGTCHACPISCFDLAEVKEGKYAGTQAGRGAATGITHSWGANCGIDNLPAIWKCKELCQRFGIDYCSAAGNIAFAMELFQRGIIDKNDTDGVELSWGNEDAIIHMLHKIALREGFGDVLADGSVKAAARIGRGAEQYVMTVKGMELSSLDPRSGSKGWVFGDLTNPRGGDNVKSTHCFAEQYNPNWSFDEYDMFDDVRAKIFCVPPEEVSSTWEGKPLYCRWFEDLYSILNAVGICFAMSGSRLSLGPNYLSGLFSACTGQDTTPQEIMKLGEKVFTLLKAYTIRQGLTRKDDTFPDRFFTEPLPDGPAKGAVLSRDTIEQLLDEYYELRNWDIRTGLPTKEKLLDMGLDYLVTDLLELGRLPDKEVIM